MSAQEGQSGHAAEIVRRPSLTQLGYQLSPDNIGRRPKPILFGAMRRRTMIC